jgi:RNA polymerase sigma-70 factor (ECF subfamily)
LTAEDEARPPIDARLQPDELAMREARIRAFYRVLDRLSEKKRTVFLLHELEGLSPAEIASLVGAPVLTVRTRLFYARRELSQLTGDEPELKSLQSELARRREPA